MGYEVILVLLVTQVFDFLQLVLGGILNALGKQKWALAINIVTYFIFVAPLSYYFAFEFGEREQIVYERGFFFDSEEHLIVPGLGIPGLFLGLCLGYLHQSASYALVATCCTNWTKIAEGVVERN